MQDFDLAEVDLVCALGLPGSEGLEIAQCLRWVDSIACWVHQEAEATYSGFCRDPDHFDGSEGIFRIVTLMNVLWRGIGVHYKPELIASAEEPTNSRASFIHGIVYGFGGTCASLPVLVASVGRRLGYPLRLVSTASHQFVRWDDPQGERFNIEISDTGLNPYEDVYYFYCIPLLEYT